MLSLPDQRSYSLALVISVLVLGCGEGDAPPRPQVVAVVNTDAVLVEQVVDDPRLSADAAIDSARIDLIDANGAVYSVFELGVADRRDWPISFGIVSAEGGGSVRFRVRLFRARYARREVVLGRDALLPPPALTIDRVVDVPLPADGVNTLEVVLSADCLGVSPSFGEPTSTCIDGSQRAGQPGEGIRSVADRGAVVSLAGTWAKGVEVPCGKPGDPHRICVPGGYSVLGDPDLVGLVNGTTVPFDASPPRPVYLRPYYLARTEYTVGQLRALLQNTPDAVKGTLPVTRDPDSTYFRYCTWLGVDDASHDAYALNCVSWDTASELCAYEGGSLPTEAQWEHAARGRGQQRPYPWGTEPPTCCRASLGRAGGLTQTVWCRESAGPEPVGSHAPLPTCDDLGDVSRDGLVDMAGSVSEWLSDAIAPYDEPCWSSPGILVDPRCVTNEPSRLALRGGAWSHEPFSATSALRKAAVGVSTVDDVGFRCAYPEDVP